MARVTTHDIARMAGVSQSTVSIILNNSNKASISEDTRGRVLKVAEELGYAPKASERKPNKGLKNVLAVVVPNLMYPYYPRLIECIEKNAINRGYSILVCNIDSKESEEYYIDLFLNNGVDGIVFAFTPNTDTIVNAIKGKVPAIVLGEKDDMINLDTIALNSMAAGNILVDHLFSLGHRHIGFVSNPSEAVSRATRRRLEGVRVKMEQLNIKDNLTHVYNENYCEVDSLDDCISSSLELTKKLIGQNPQITAIITPDDITCIGVIDALRQLNKKIPEDIALCSFDDTDISRILYPSVTTIDHGNQIRSKFAIDLLVERINNHDKSGRIYKTESEPNLIVRGSTVKNKK